MKTSKLRVTGLCSGNSPGTSDFSTKMASNAENVSIWWRHHELQPACMFCLFFHFYYFTSLIYMYSKGILRLLRNLLVRRVSSRNSCINCATICLTTNVYFGSVFMMINTNMHIWSRAGHSTLLSFAFVFVLCMYKSATDSIGKFTV